MQSFARMQNNTLRDNDEYTCASFGLGAGVGVRLGRESGGLGMESALAKLEQNDSESHHICMLFLFL